MANVTLTIDLNSKCVECRQPGATPSGICMSCAARAMKADSVMKSAQGKAVQKRFENQFASAKKRLSILNEDDGNG